MVNFVAMQAPPELHQQNSLLRSGMRPFRHSASVSVFVLVEEFEVVHDVRHPGRPEGLTSPASDDCGGDVERWARVLSPPR